jgi:hypothetical protein
MSRPRDNGGALLGDLPDPGGLERWIHRSVLEPNTGADELPYLLRVSSMEICDQVSTAAEVAYIRWATVAETLDEAGQSKALPGRLADALRKAGIVAIVFDADGRPFRMVVDAIGNRAASILGVVLRGAVFVVPCMEWDRETAAAIEADCSTQQLSTQRESGDTWLECAERTALAAEAAKWAKQVSARLKK